MRIDLEKIREEVRATAIAEQAVRDAANLSEERTRETVIAAEIPLATIFLENYLEKIIREYMKLHPTSKRLDITWIRSVDGYRLSTEAYYRAVKMIEGITVVAIYNPDPYYYIDLS